MKTKQFLPFLVSIFLPIACERNINEIKLSDSTSNIVCNITGEMPTFSSEPLTDTKSSIEAILRINWSKGDKLSVINLTTGKKLGGYIEAQSDGNQVQFIGKNLNGGLNVGHRLLFINDSDTYSNEETDFNPSIIDFSVQKGDMNSVPYCIYATHTATDEESINVSFLKFNFLISYIQLAVSGLPASSEISDFTINGICSKCEISVSGGEFTATPVEDNLSFSEPFASNSKGAQMRYFSTFQSEAKESARTMSASAGNLVYPGTWIKAALNKGTYYQSVAAGFTDNYIHFKDELFKSLCVAEADINGDGEVSHYEASLITSFVKWSNGYPARKVIDASDLVYFTSLTDAPVFSWYGSDLKSIVFPPSIKHIPARCCYEADDLISLTLPINVESIGAEAFYTTSGSSVVKHDITLPPSLKSIGHHAFTNASIRKITIPGTVETIGSEAFSYTDLEEIIIESPSTVIKDKAFTGCANLTEVTIPEGTEVLDALFPVCKNLETVHLPSTLKKIFSSKYEDDSEYGNGAFFHCDKLLNVDLPEGLLVLKGYVFAETNIESITIPSTVIEIGNYCFSYCKKLEKINIPLGLKTIGKGAFHDCDHLTSLDIGNSSITSIGDYAFENCIAINEICLPKTLKTLGYGVFEGMRIVDLDIPDSVTDIGEFCFSSMPFLTTLSIGSGCIRLPRDIISNSPSIEELHIRATIPPAILSNTFSNIPSELKIFVPKGSRDTYINASNWSVLADLIFEEE